MQDEVFAHRLGLIPLRADPRKFDWKSAETDDAGTERDTLEFQLKVKCKRSPTAAEVAEEACVDRCVYSRHIKWIPRGDQAARMEGTDPGPTEGDILLNKMLPGTCIFHFLPLPANGFFHVLQLKLIWAAYTFCYD